MEDEKNVRIVSLTMDEVKEILMTSPEVQISIMELNSLTPAIVEEKYSSFLYGKCKIPDDERILVIKLLGYEHGEIKHQDLEPLKEGE